MQGPKVGRIASCGTITVDTKEANRKIHGTVNPRELNEQIFREKLDFIYLKVLALLDLYYSQ
jgi:hypothetical protein